MESPETSPPDPRSALRTVCAFVCLLATAVACYEVWQSSNARLAVAALEAKAAADRAEALRLNALSRNELRESAAISAEWKAEEERLTPKKPIPDRKRRGEAFIRDNPEFPAMAAEAMHALARSWPAERSRALGFTEAQTQAIIALIEKHPVPIFFNTLDLPAGSGGGSYGDTFQALAAIVGEDGAKKFNSASDSEVNGRTAAAFSQAASDLGVGVTGQQAIAVAQAIAAATDVHGATDWAKVQVPASVGLSGDQQQVLVQFENRRIANEAVIAYRNQFEQNR